MKYKNWMRTSLLTGLPLAMVVASLVLGAYGSTRVSRLAIQPKGHTADSDQGNSIEDSAIQVQLTEFNIDIPVDEIMAGVVFFEIKNNGPLEHDFEIERSDNEDERYSVNVKPGEAEMLRAEMNPGMYLVHWPVPGVDEPGYALRLIVI